MASRAFTPSRPLRVGTDCSGIDAPIVALRELKIPFSHEFSSEIDPHCITTLRANVSPKILFGDMTRRPLRDIPDIDLYVCGFPCQPFSTAGKRLGEQDPRGTIFYECLRVIRRKKPMVFLLENVPGILSIDQGRTFRTIMEALGRLRMYHVEWKILNTADYGIPQSRKRVFIVGIRKGAMERPFEWPTPIESRLLTEFVDWSDRQPYERITPKMEMILKRQENTCFINLSFPYDNNKNSWSVSPTITASANIWCTRLRRYANVKEYLSLQGFDYRVFRCVVSVRQMKKQLGNTMSVNVLTNLLKKIFRTLTPILDEA